MSKQLVGNGIVRRNGGWVMLCGSTEQPIRLVDATGKEITRYSEQFETAKTKGAENVDIAIKREG